MQFLRAQQPMYDLTYDDVFLVPAHSSLQSRFDISIQPADGSGATIPLVVANMNAVAGKRMSETIARRGGITVLPQDIPLDVVAQMIGYIKTRHTVYETPLKLRPDNTIMDALNILHKRAHGMIVIVDAKDAPVGIFTEADGEGCDRFTPLSAVMDRKVVTIPYGLPLQKIFETLHQARVTAAPVIKSKKLAGIITQKGALRSDLYKPAVDKKHRLLTAVAVGINGNVADKTEKLLAMGADILVVDTAHGHQQKMIDAIKAVRSVSKTVPLVAGNVVTAEATEELVRAGANVIKVGIGPGAMCTTRVMTGVGRPQFSAVLECSAAAKRLGGHVWADGGVRYPRDVALALAAGASNVMFGSMWAGTYESVGDVLRDKDGRLYKENFGMASKRAVRTRNQDSSVFERMKKEFFEEGISASKLYLHDERPGAEDIVDYMVAGLRSAIAYSGAMNLTQFHEKAIVGLQSTAGFKEGLPIRRSWD